MKRRESREAALIAVYEKTINQNTVDEIFECAKEAETYKADAYSKRLCNIVFENIDEIDSAIKRNLNRRVLERVPALPLAIMRISCAEMMFIEEVPNNISINEAVSLAKKYCDDDYVYINGILGSVFNELSGEEAFGTIDDTAADDIETQPEIEADGSNESQPEGESDGKIEAGNNSEQSDSETSGHEISAEVGE